MRDAGAARASVKVLHPAELPPLPDQVSMLEEIASLPEVARVVALPDLHWKDRLEAPSSVAYGVRGHLIPQLSSCAVNCGMGLVATGASEGALTPERLDAFYSAFRASRTEAASRFDLDPAALGRIVTRGARAVAERYELDPEAALRGMESRGNVLPGDCSLEEARDALDPEILADPGYEGLRDLGLGFAGNHFLETQVLDSVLDERACARFGLERGRVFVAYHGGGGVVPGFVGGYYGNRQKGYVRNLRFWASKVKLHFRRPRDWVRFRERWRYYFSGARFPAIPVSGPEGRRNRVALAVAMNYGYAYRTAMLARIAWALERTLGRDLSGSVCLVWDASHNTISEEEISGEKLVVHRHNAVRVRPGELVMLPGHNTTPTLLGVGLEGTSATLDSMPHGAGETVDAFVRMGLAGEPAREETRRYGGEKTVPRLVAHRGRGGLEAVARLLEERRIWRPIAALRPIGVLKDYHHG